MRSRIVGGIALLLGLVAMYAVLSSKKPIEGEALLGGLLFIGMGGYYLFTGKKAATMDEFILDGKLSHDKTTISPCLSEEARSVLVEKALNAPDFTDRNEALQRLGLSVGLSQAQMDGVNQQAKGQAAQKLDEILDKLAKEHGLTEAQRKELEAPYREKLAEMFPSENG